MNFKNKKLIIFDFDGTLINSIPDLANGINATLKHFGRKTFSVEEITTWVGKGVEEMLHKAIEASDDGAEKLELQDAVEFYQHYYKKNVCNDTYVYDGVPKTLDYLSNHGYRMVICTNKPFQFIEPILDCLEIKKYFSLWIGGDSLESKKPNPEPLIYLANQNNVKVKECVMIGDSKNDIIAAHNANMDSIAVNYGYNYNEPIEDSNPTKIISNFNELQSIF